jgi:1,4-alpha-glucan branching enzyme
MANPQVTKSKQSFSIRAPAALSVQLVGDFTHWQKTPIQMHKEADGVWRASAELAPGTYHYRFLVDGEWRDDPENTLRVPNVFGTENSVRKVA